MASEYGEPWSIIHEDITEEGAVQDAKDEMVFTYNRFTDESYTADERKARRIVACVNFCANLTDEYLQSHRLMDFNGLIQVMRNE